MAATLRLWDISTDFPLDLAEDAISGRVVVGQVVVGQDDNFYVTSGDDLTNTIFLVVSIADDTITPLFTSDDVGVAGNGVAVAAKIVEGLTPLSV